MDPKDTKTDQDKSAATPEATPPVEAKAPVSTVPTVDSNAPLKIDQVKESAANIPETDLKAPLKVEEDETEEEVPLEKTNNKLFIIGGVVLVVIILAVIGFFIFSVEESQEEIITTEQTEVSPEPSVAPKETLNRADLSFEVVNGSGVSGAAKKAADKLEALGYKVTKTGNADKNNYKESELLLSEDLQSKAEFILTDLKTVFKMASASGKLSDSTASAKLIVGKE